MKKLHLTNHFKKCLTPAILLLTIPLFSGYYLPILQPAGDIAAQQKHLLIVATLLMLIIVVPVAFLIFYICWKYRATNTKAKYSPDWSHNIWLEIIWWTIPCVIIGILAVMTWTSTHELDPYHPLPAESHEAPLKIDVIALNWKWLFIYPKQDIATVNYITIPTDRPIEFRITSDAPMNSFSIPQLAGQVYAMTGMQTKLHLNATKPGIYEGQSTNYSGAGFSGMNFQVRATSEKNFQDWVKKVHNRHDSLTFQKYDVLREDSQNNPVHYYSSVNQNLYWHTVMKYMMPMKDDMRSKGVKMT